MFQRSKTKDTEEELDNDVVSEKEEDLNKEDLKDPPAPTESSEPADYPKDPSADGDDEDESDEKDDENDEVEDEPEKTETHASKKIAVQQEPSSDEDSDVEDAEMDDLFEPEGELAIDVYQTDSDIVIQSAIAGVKPEEIDISVEDDIVTIRGIRKNPEQNEDKQYFHEECFWGPFSRQIFLPEEIDTKNVQASLKNGILTLRLPRTALEKTKKVKLKKK